MTARASGLTLATALAVVLVQAHAAPPNPDEVSASPRASDDIQDLVLFAKARPVFLRLHIRVGGESYETAWHNAIDRLFKYLDADNDGRLSESERARTGLLQEIMNQAETLLARRQGMATTPALSSASSAGLVTADDLRAYLRPWYGPTLLRVAQPNSSGPELLFNTLDTNGDRSLAREECEAAVESLQCLDHDDDETIQLQEVQPYQNPFFGRVQTASKGEDGAGESALALLSATESRTRMVRSLLKRYDRPEQDHKLSRSELAMNPSTFERADGDGDGGLDSDELVHYLRAVVPELELEVRMSGGGQPRFEVVRSPEPKDDSTQIRTTPAGGVTLVVDLDHFEMNVSDTNNALSSRQIFASQFRAADTDNNKYLDSKEARRGALINGDTFKLMDRNGDGKLFEPEMNEFIDEDASVAQNRTLLSVEDQGNSLFDVLDDNRDRQLTVRELHGVFKKVSGWDRNGDGRVSQDEVPHSYQVLMGRGQPMLLARFGVVTNPVGTVRPPNMRGLGSAPAWFTRMDRNRDGDVSRREFLGTLADFQRLDADHDDLLDRNEAAKAR